MCLPTEPGSSCASGASTSTKAMTPVMAPAVCRTRAPIASANRPSIIRYRPAPNRARTTPLSPRLTGALLCTIGAAMKNAPKATTSPITKITAAKTRALAASMGVRFGAASSEARIMPVEYSLVITMAPRTQIASWPRTKPEPRMLPVASRR